LFYSAKIWFKRTFGKPRALLVLGMHRSGGSFVASALQQAGLEMADSSAADGSVEQPRVVALNDTVLEESGGRWDQPPAQVEWSGAQLARGRELVNDCAAPRDWGIKDPRLLLTLGGWQDLLPKVQPVGVFRHPLAVAKSLQANCGITDTEQAMALWLEYNHRLLAQYRRVAFPIICFDPLRDQLNARAGKLATALGLPKPRRVTCFDAERVTQYPGKDTVLSPDVQSLYASLQTIALV